MKILFYPDGANKRWGITKAKHYIRHCGYDMTSNPDDSFDSVIYWSYHKGVRPLDGRMVDISKHYDVINIGCWDITKTHNELCMQKAFGYNSMVSPLRRGTFCEKSELQGRHDIRIVKGPISEMKEGYIYVKLLENKVDEDTLVCHRLFLDEKNISFVLIMKQTLENRFKGQLVAKDLRVVLDPLECFSQEEIDGVYRYCKHHGSHFTELDVIRDKDGRIYIIDNNNVPAYASTLKTLLDATNTFRLLVNSFAETVKLHAR